MADKRISQLVDRGTVANNDVVPIVVSGATTTNKATISSIQTFMQGNLDVGVTSVGITLGSTGTDVNVSGSPVTSSGNITINIPSASATNRGLVTTGAQTIAGAKTFNSDIIVNGVTVGKGGASNGNNTAIGVNALSSNTTGTLNTATGISALQFNTAGNSNTANGASSLVGNTTGGFNTAIGNQSLYSNTTGQVNTAIGLNSLYSNITGTYNTGIGASAGYYIADGSTPNTTSDFSIYLGADTKASVDNAQNEVVIGYNAIGSGSNTVTIGNSSTTLNKFFGATQSDTFRLPSDGGGNQVTIFENIGTIHQGTASINNFGFNNSNNIYFGKGLNNGGVIQFTNAAVRYYTLPDADGTIALTSDLSGYVTLGTAQTITAQKTFTGSGGSDTMIISHGSGSGFALDVIKAGNGEVMRVLKTSGSGNAMTVQGGNFEAPTIVKTGGTSAQFLMADGSVNTSVLASGAYLPLTGGTLTGALNGTSAVFSSTVSATQYTATSTGGSGLRVYGGSGTNQWDIYLNSTNLRFSDNTGTGNIVFDRPLNGTSAVFSANSNGVTLNAATGTTNTQYKVANTSGDAYFGIAASDGSSIFTGTTANSGYVGTNNNFPFHLATNGTVRLTLASTGAATFSSSVTAGGGKSQFVASGGASAGAGISLNTGLSGTGRRNWFIGTEENIEGDFTIKCSTAAGGVGGSGDTRLSILNNGNVGIGTATSGQKLTVNGNVLLNASDSKLYFSQINNIERSAIIQTELGGENNHSLLFFTNPSFGLPTERMRITSGGDVLINTANATARLNMTFGGGGENGFSLLDGDNTVNATFIDFKNSSGTIIGHISRAGGTNAVVYMTTSDYRLKEDFKEIKGLEKVQAIKVYDFQWKDTNERTDGVIAHELAEVVPFAVTGEKDEINEDGTDKMQGVDYSKIVPILIKAIQEQQEQIDSLKNQIK